MAADKAKTQNDRPSRSESDAAAAEFVARAEQLLGEPSGPDAAVALLPAALSLAPQAAGQAFALLARRLQERALPLLREVALSSQPRHAREAVTAMGHIRHADSAAALQTISEGNVAKDVRKEAKRSLFRLRAAGFEAVAEQPPAQEVAGRVLAAKVSNVDGWGNYIVVLAVAAPLGAAETVAVVINEERGIVECSGTRLPRADLERQIATIAQGTPTLHIVDAPVDYCRQAVLNAHERNRATGQQVPPEFYAWRHVVGQPERVPEREPVYDEINPAVVRLNPRLLEESGELMHAPEFQSWIIPPEVATQAIEEGARRRSSRIILPNEMQMDPGERTIDMLLVGFFNEQRRLDYSRRLAQSAYVLKKIGREADARRAVAAALALQPSSTTPLVRQPLLVELARHTLAYLEASQAQDVQRPSGLLLPPR